MEESHFLDMIRAVQPHVSGRPKRSVDLILQSASLLSSVHHYQEPALSACSTASDSIDFEAVLMDLQPVCNPAEAELVNLILNFFRSRKIYSAYQMASQQPVPSAADIFNTSHPMKAAGAETEDPDFEGRMPEDPVSEETVSKERKTKEPWAEEQRANEPGTEGAQTEKQGAEEPQAEKQGTKEPQTEKQGTKEPQTEKRRAEEQKEKQKNFHRNQNFQNLMENHALQSLLSPSQKENLNRIGNLMQVLS